MPLQPSYNPYAADQQPNLSLADTPDVASGYGVTVMPTSMPPIPRELPDLSCADPCQDMIDLGIDPGVFYFDLNLGGINPLPNPPYTDDANAVAPMTSTPSNLPWTCPIQFSDGALQKALTDPGIDWKPPFGVDPALPDLTFYVQPKGMAPIIAAKSDPMAIDPIAPDLMLYDRPDNLALLPPLMVDPNLPDLKYPTLDQDVLMPDRPGELNPAAMNIMHGYSDDKQVPADDYESLWMTQTGNNSRRQRHLGMLDLGLEREESGR